MGLVNANNMLYYARNYRIVYLGGRYGGGKTSFCFRLAYELVRRFEFRYVLSNVASVWNDRPEDVVLRNGKYVDAVIILDEGGEFLDSPAQAKKWLSFLRKINVVLLVPSVIEPARMLRRLSVARIMNGFSLGLPFWMYQLELKAGLSVTEKDTFFWTVPQEIFGIYDTIGMPTDAEELLDYVKQWTGQAAETLGYSNTASKLGAKTGFSGFGLTDEQDTALDEVRGYLDEIRSAQEETTRALSASGNGRRGRRRRR